MCPKKVFSLLALLSVLLQTIAATPNGPMGAPGGRKSAPADAVPYLRFVENRGQWDDPSRFRCDLIGGRLWLRDGGLTYALYDQAQLEAIHEKYYHDKTFRPGERMDDEIVRNHAFKVDFLGSLPAPTYRTEGGSSPIYNYFIGNDRSKWATNMRTWQKVSADEVYPGIGLDMYSREGNLKYDFRVAPGADPSKIQMAYQGQDRIFLQDGNLHIVTSVRLLTEMHPYAYQIVNGEEVEVPCKFVLKDNVLSFDFPQGYSPVLPLVIDPTLVAGTYSGSTATCYGHSATYDDLGNIYAAGICFGQGFPTTVGAYQTAYGGGVDFGINKYSPDATVLLYSTYIGGSAGDYPHSMIVNSVGELCVLGSTGSNNFPLTQLAVDQSFMGFSEIAICHLNITGSAMLGSTFLGGSDDDGRNGGGTNFNYGDTYRGEVMVDAQDNILIASVTNSSDFPTTPGVFGPGSGGGQEGIIAKVNPTCTSLIFSTYIGGPGDDCANSIKVNAAGELFVAGASEGGLSTTPGAFQTNNQGGVDGYVLRINPNATTIIAGTYVGTVADDPAYFVELDYNGFPYVLGQSPSYPVSPGVYSQAGGTLYVQKLNGNLTSSVWSTVLGDATSGLSPTAFLVDICGNIYAAGWGDCSTLPMTPNAYQPNGGDDFYLVVLNPNASGLLYATAFGGNGWEHVDGGTSRFDRLGVVYEASCSSSNNWPTTPGAAFPNPTTGSWDVVCFKFEFNFVGIAASFASANAPNGCAPFPVNFVNNSTNTPSTLYWWDFGTGDTDTVANPTYVYNQAGTYTVTLIVRDTAACAGSDTATLQVVITANPPLNLDQDTTFCYGDSIQLHAPVLPQATYLWSPANGLSNPNIPNPMAEPNATTAYTLTVTDSAGCASTGTVTIGVIVVNADAGPFTSYCEGEGGAQFVAGQPTGGTGPYYYTWWCDQVSNPFCGIDSINDNDPVANPTNSGWYFLQVSDFNGCLSYIDSTYLEVLPKPIVDAGPDVSMCQPPAPGALISATVLNAQDAPGPYVITWSPGIGLNDSTIFSPFARPDTTTIYTAVVLSSNGCSSALTTVDTLSSITVTVHPRPIADAGPDIHACLYDSTVMVGLGHGAGPDYDFEWTPSAGLSSTTSPNPNAAPAFTHEYTLVVWSNGCPSYGDTMTFNVHTLPTPSAGPIQEICLGDTAHLDAFGAGDSTAFYTYQWLPAATLSDPTAENPLAFPVSTTQYHLIVTSNWGCSSPVDTVQVTVKPTPIADAGPNVTICEGDSIQVLGSYYYTTTGQAPVNDIFYSWNPGAAIGDTTQMQPWVWPTQSTMFYMDVRYNTCLTQDSMLLSVIPTDPPLAEADTNIACQGVPVQLTASGGIGSATFTWSPATGLSDPNSPNPVATPDSSISYTVTMTEGGCTTSAKVDLQVIPAPVVSYLSSLQQGCAPFSVSFLSNSDNTILHSWNFGDGSVSNETAPVHTYDQAGTYPVTLTAINTGSCESSTTLSTIEVFDPIQTHFSMAPVGNPAATLLPLELYLPATGVTFQDLSNGPVSEWHWEFGDGTISTEKDPVHSYLEPGMYYPVLTTVNAYGCVSKLQQGPVVITIPDLFIPNVFSPNGDGINDQFTVQYRGSQPFNLQVFDRWGVELHQTLNKEAHWDGRNQDGQPVTDGVYFYNLNIGGKGYTGEVTLVR